MNYKLNIFLREKRVIAFLLYSITLTISLPTYADQPKQVQINAKEFSFSPSSIEVKTGQELQITLSNHGALAHNITFKSQDIATKTIQTDDKTTTTVSFSKPGRYEFICSVPGHANAGMKGKVIVK